MTKRILALFLACVMVISLVACGNKKDNKNENENSETTQPTETIEATEPYVTEGGDERTQPFIVADNEEPQKATIKFSFNKPSNVSLAFVQALATNQYNVVLSTLNIDNSPFVTSEDIKIGLQKSQYAKLFENAGKKLYAIVEKEDCTQITDKASAIVRLRDENDNDVATYNISLVLNKENKWLITDTSFYIENFYISAPGNTKVFIDGEEVTEKYKDGSRGYSDLLDRYKLIAIGRAPKEYKIECNSFSTTGGLLAIQNKKEEPFAMNKNLAGDELTEALNATKDLWNNLYKEYCNNVPVNELGKYLTDNVDEQNRNEIYRSFAKLIEGPGGHKNIDHRITEIEKRKDAECFYITDKIIVMNVQYQLDWTWTFTLGGPENCRLISHILVEKTNDGYKIHEISDMGFFRNNEGKDW